MALVAHWPLTDTMEDYSGHGYNGKAIDTVESSNNGKIGKALVFTKGGNGVNIENNFVDLLDNEYTFAVWVNPAGDHLNYNGTFISSGDWNSNCWAFGVSQTNDAIDVAGRSYNKYISYNVPLNTWTHIVSTCKDNIAKLYVNGEFIGVKDVTTKIVSSATNTTIGRETYIGGHFSFNGMLNDLRIYNHEMSLKEIKELYKTKILDWKMNESGEPTTNILPNSWQFFNYDVSSEANFTSQLSRDISFGVVLKRKIYSKSMEYRGNNRIYRKIAVNSGNQYTFSSWVYSDVANDLLLRYELFGGDYTWQGDGVRHNGTGWEYLSITTPILTSNCDLYFMFYGVGHNSSVYINAMQLELGSRSNNYVLTNRDGKVIDSSGFKNHGLIEAGSSPRYSNGEYLLRVNDELSKITSDIIFPKTFTVIYQSYDDNGYRASSDRWHIGQSESTSSSTIGWAYSQGYGEDMGYARICNSEGTIHNTRIGSSNITINKYENNAFIFNYESGEISSYLNGNILGTLAYGNSDTALNLSKFSVGSSYTNNNRISGKIKNVRVYATALSKVDIDKIFSNEISIDKKYNISCSEIIEEENMFSLKRVTMGNLTTTAFTYTKNYSDMSITLKNDGEAGSARMNFTKAVLMPLYGIDFLLSFKLKGILNPDFVPTDFNDGGFLEKRFIHYEKLGYYEWILKVNTVNINDVYQFLDFNIGANCEILLYDFKLMPLTSTDNINFTNNGKIIVASINEIDFTDNFNITNTYELICNSFSEV